MKIALYIFFSIFIYSCKKYNCECISTYNNPPKSNITTSSIQKVQAISKSKAQKTCKKYEDDNTTCEIK